MRAQKLLIFCSLLFLISHTQADNAVSPEDALKAITLLELAGQPEVENQYRRLLEAHPQYAPARIAFGDFLLRNNRPREAETQWLNAARADPKNPEPANRLGGYHLRHTGDIRQSAAYFEKAVALSPEIPQYHIDLANVLSVFRHDLHRSAQDNSGRILQQALEHYRKAVELDPENAHTARIYAEAFYIQASPDWSQALKAWEHATSLMPEKDFGYLHLARVSLKQNDKSAALRYLENIKNKKYFTARERLRKQAE